MEFIRLTPVHTSHVHDIAFDFYGKRFCSCSSDRIRIWDFDEETKHWSCYDLPRAPHQNSVWRLSWAHPEFGQVFASCSEDRMICIWEEWGDITVAGAMASSSSLSASASGSSSSSSSSVPASSGIGGGAKQQRWQCKAQLTDSKRAVNDVKFAPRHLGLKLASASSDGYVRIYEATDVFSLNYWQLQDSIQVEVTSAEKSNADSGVQSVGPQQGRESEHGLTCLSWNECPFETEMLAVGGHSKRASILIRSKETGKWFEGWSHECQGVVHDIAWAPVMGRSYHQIATASREGSCLLHRLKRSSTPNGPFERLGDPIEIKTSSPVWRVAWNATGTVLATSSEDGTLSLWRKDANGKWSNVEKVAPGVGGGRRRGVF